MLVCVFRKFFMPVIVNTCRCGLNRVLPFFRWSVIVCLMTVLFNAFIFFPSYGSDTNTLDILSFIENKEYLSAARLLEKGIRKNRDRKTKGYYALLLHQIPLNIPTKKPRHEYAFMAASWAVDVSRKKRMQLWIEAADGFFKTGSLEKADTSYQKALPLAFLEKAQSEITYILFKMAWIQINDKKWVRAFRFLVQALEEKENNLMENIASNMGQIWVESQYSESNISLKELVAGISSLSSEWQKTMIRGIVRGMRRTRKKGINKIVSILSADKQLSTRVLNHILSDETSVIASPCQLLVWMETALAPELNREKALSLLNSCTHALISVQRKRKWQREQIGKIISLYEKFERRGVERWPLIQIYESVGQNDSACDESLRQLTETMKRLNPESGNEKIKETMMETFRLCKKTGIPPSFSEEAIKNLLSSGAVIQGYKTVEGEWENILFQLLDMKIFHPVIQKNILIFDRQWKGKDLPPILFLSHIQKYKPEEVKAFLDRFSPKPVDSYYLDILAAGDFLTVEELQKWLPLSGIDSYRKIPAWLKKAISGELNEGQKKIVIGKLLEHFPSGGKDRKDASLFLALHYLKTEQVSDIFKHWNKISTVFEKKNLAVELFEKSFSHGGEVCTNLKSLLASKSTKSHSLLKFMGQCCQVMESKTTLHGFRTPSVLRSNPLAEDFVFFVQTQNKTLWLEKNISRLQNRTSGMIMDLKTVITKYEKRSWHLETLAVRSKALLQKQIDLFEAELTKLAASSPYGDKYRELKKIVSQWR